MFLLRTARTKIVLYITNLMNFLNPIIPISYSFLFTESNDDYNNSLLLPQTTGIQMDHSSKIRKMFLTGCNSYSLLLLYFVIFDYLFKHRISETNIFFKNCIAIYSLWLLFYFKKTWKTLQWNVIRYFVLSLQKWKWIVIKS